MKLWNKILETLFWLFLVIFAFAIKEGNEQTKPVSAYGKYQAIHKQLKPNPPRTRLYQINDKSFRKQVL